MKKIYYLKTCSTCMRILKTLQPDNSVQLQDIKEEPLTVKQLDEMKALSGSYQALFSKRAKLYKEMGLKDLPLKEADYKQYILEHYTFLSRPVIVVEQKIFVGNSKATILEAKKALNE
ncbi:MAG TPA: ArsC/Spx/MgsR family protein [Flavobacteriaceae bacterium]|nr:ArsC/Spx/MgsR family protein [Flavobacteriaceae bacterium]